MSDNFTIFDYIKWADGKDYPGIDTIKTRLGTSKFTEALKKAGVNNYHKTRDGFSYQEVLGAYERAREEFGYVTKKKYDEWARVNNLPSSFTLVKYLSTSHTWKELFQDDKYKHCIDSLKLAEKDLPDNFTAYDYDVWARRHNKPRLDTIKAYLGTSTFEETAEKAGINSFRKNVEKGYTYEQALDAYERAQKEFGYISRLRYSEWAKTNQLPGPQALLKHLNCTWKELFPKSKEQRENILAHLRASDKKSQQHAEKKYKKYKKYSEAECYSAIKEAVQHFKGVNFSPSTYDNWALENEKPAHITILSRTAKKWSEVKEQAFNEYLDELSGNAFINNKNEIANKIYTQNEAIEYIKCSKLTFVKYAEKNGVQPFKVVGGKKASIKLYWQDDLDFLYDKIPRRERKR